MKDWTTATLEFAEIPEAMVRGTLFGIASRIIKRSPVDTGRFRNNWQATVNSPATGVTPATDKTGNKAVQEASALINNFQIGSTFYLTNNLPYANRLEFGWSKQAPSGMVRISVAEIEQRMKEAAK
jgi:hypothetical protein